MNTRSWRFSVLTVIVAPLSLGLAGCEDSANPGAGLSGDPIENIAPPENQSWSGTIAKTEAGGYRMGNPDAPIKLVEYGSLTCPHCAEFTEASSKELRTTFIDSGRVSFEFRNFVLNSLDLTMAMMTRCGTPESFFALKEQTFANQQPIIERWTQAGEAQAQEASAQPPETRYLALARLAGLPEFYAARGISTDQASTCLADSAAAEELVENTNKQSDEFQITGTPAFLINGSKTEGNTWAAVKTALEQAGAR